MLVLIRLADWKNPGTSAGKLGAAGCSSMTGGLGFGRQIIAKLGSFCLDLRERQRGVVGRLQVNGDVLTPGARRLQVVDTTVPALKVRSSIGP